MSCNGCRVLRKGCSESCILRPCLQWIDTPEAQGHATVFVAKFFGRAGLMSFISNVPHNQRPALFQSLLYEACGRTVNPVNGAVGLLWTGNWHICQGAVDTVLRGGTLRPIPELLNGISSDEASGVLSLNSATTYNNNNNNNNNNNSRRKRSDHDRNTTTAAPKLQLGGQLDLSLTPAPFPYPAAASSPAVAQRAGLADCGNGNSAEKNHKQQLFQRPATPSLNSEESVTTVSFESGCGGDQLSQAALAEPKLLNLFA